MTTRGSRARTVRRWSTSKPTMCPTSCSRLGEVRNGPLLATTTAGQVLLAYGFMYERNGNYQDFETARFRVSDVGTGATGITPRTTFDNLRAWKSSPSYGPLLRGSTIG